MTPAEPGETSTSHEAAQDSPRDRRRQLGATGLTLPRVVYGTTCLGNLFVAMSEDEKRELIRQWFVHQPSPIAIDSAGKYGAGLALEVLGRELGALGVDPSSIVLSNKLAWRRVPLTGPEPTFEPGVWVGLQHDAVQDIGYDGILRCYEDGCRLLGAYRPQLVSLHDPDEYLAAASDSQERRLRWQHLLDAYRALEELREAGLVAGVGVGAKDWRTIRELDQHVRLDWAMMANSFTVMNHPVELIEFLDSLYQRRVGLINSAVMHGGFLGGGQFLDYRKIDPGNPQDARRLEWRNRFVGVCQHYGVTPYHAAVVFGLSHPAVVSVALSTTRPERVGEMVEAAQAAIPSSLWNDLRVQGLIDPGYPHLRAS